MAREQLTMGFEGQSRVNGTQTKNKMLEAPLCFTSYKLNSNRIKRNIGLVFCYIAFHCIASRCTPLLY